MSDRVSALTTIRLIDSSNHAGTDYISNNFLRDTRSITRRWVASGAEYTEIVFTSAVEVRVVETPEEIAEMLRGAGS